MTKPLTILLWSQEEDHQELLAYNLVKEGFIVSSVATEEEIVSQAFVIQPDIILMGDCSTDELFIAITKTIKEAQQDTPPRVVCLTTKTLPNPSHPVCMASDACLALPAKPKDIISVLVNMVSDERPEACC